MYFAQKSTDFNTLLLLRSRQFPLVSEISDWLGKYCHQFRNCLIWKRAYEGEDIQNNYTFKLPISFKGIEMIQTFRQENLSENTC